MRKENIPLLSQISSTQIQLATGYDGQAGKITLGGLHYTVQSPITCNLATTGFNGLDAGSVAANTIYYVYAVINNSNTLGLVCSISGSGPTGFTVFKHIGYVRTYPTTATIVYVENVRYGDIPSYSITNYQRFKILTPSNNNFLCTDGDHLVCNTSTGAFTIYLPAAPQVGGRVIIYDAENTFATNNLTVNRNGKNINGVADNLIINISGSKVELIFISNTYGWRIFT